MALSTFKSLDINMMEFTNVLLRMPMGHQRYVLHSALEVCSIELEFSVANCKLMNYSFVFFVEEISFERRAGSLTVAKGDTAKFKCRPLHATDNMSIKWRRKGKTLKKDEKYDIDYETLTIKNVAQEDCGEYYCVVRDGPSIVTSTGTLAIKDGKFLLYIQRIMPGQNKSVIRK
jgi:hypothetical protein